MKKKVVIGISGGVDSSVSAWLLKKNGYHVEGVFMKNWEENNCKSYCSIKQDLQDAQCLCEQIGINLTVLNFSKQYWDKVFKIFLKEYQLGKTPNPDILCNKEIKFKVFLNFAFEEMQADYIATGHYARRVDFRGKSYLFSGIDMNKDQSYFLHQIKHQEISKCLFPVGNFIKLQVRHIASQLNLITANKKDSTGICFIGKRNFKKFIKNYLLASPGIITSIKNKKIGYHPGLIYYTIGQRKGININSTYNTCADPWYVADKDVKKNSLIVVQGRNHLALLSVSIIVIYPHWIDQMPLNSELKCTIKTRYRQENTGCLIKKPKSKKYLKVIFDQPIFAVTPGQSAVFYLKNRCLGGGIIHSRTLLHDLLNKSK
ncbi:tRNA (5-methylaminomethyl-2-thiouridylate)-methyltransferase [Wigglesworthia glossinidia endosymbiont of Glossina morsitans morsitans (Yale colony)]|uniref:tRNA-specific 2-thiouridylase MnmA n=1 Tax=Wigglesworthia glossinidia endosymbiont of Glossina morsitans morsitans (Yale colony) TaxID=1142511 RepID=H6Q5R5_WIGGL|nr:tRNA 2-thiouridine(34) synthase MnmA [Wigglesworthia glossinidia]AFA40970.1 tRNA (5-methylaminomethyl-2-thiouridylate)-methyltransferase [Wigglesworthia glossinidia endosymbiont of Glossina morsitans morsitans (Yale colony)]